jgi:hypothetical protein
MPRSLVVLAVLLSSVVARAQVPAPEPSECTTTIRCTGAAAPYAVNPPAAPPVVVAPPVAPNAYLPPLQLPSPTIVGRDWVVFTAPDGTLWRMRNARQRNAAVWGTGLAFWMGGYLTASIGGTMVGDPLGWLPVFGSIFGTIFGGDPGVTTMFAISTLAQVGGIVAFSIGLHSTDHFEKEPLTIGPTAFIGGGNGIALRGRF